MTVMLAFEFWIAAMAFLCLPIRQIHVIDGVDQRWLVCLGQPGIGWFEFLVIISNTIFYGGHPVAFFEDFFAVGKGLIIDKSAAAKHFCKL